MIETRQKYNRQRLDRDSWTFGRGPWDQESDDEVCWKHPTEDLGCVLRRNKFCGSWVALVAIPPSHPLFGVDPLEAFPDLINLSGTVYWGHFAYEIPGIPAASDWWWIGFDTHHPLASFVCGEDVEKRMKAKSGPRGQQWRAMRAKFEKEWSETYRNEAQSKELLSMFVDRIKSIDPSIVAGKKKYG